jgi:long-subunit fatty acid transport protein
MFGVDVKIRQKSVHRSACLGVVVGILFLAPQPLWAAMGENIAISPRAMSMGNAVTADTVGTEAVHYNPAGLTKIRGKQGDTHIALAKVRNFAEFNKPANYEGIFGYTEDPVIGQRSISNNHQLYVPGYGVTNAKMPVLVAPGNGWAYNDPDSRFTFATAVFLPMAVTYDRSEGDDDPARYGGRKTIMQRFTYLAPSVGYKVNDTLSLGITGSLSHFALVTETDFRAPNTLIAMTARLQEALCPEGGNPIDAVLFGLCSKGSMNPFTNVLNMNIEMTTSADPTVTVGMLWEPNDWFAFGAKYSSESKMRLHGKYKITYDESVQEFFKGVSNSALGPIILASLAMPSYVPPEEEGNVSLTLTYPKSIQMGTKMKFGKLQVNTDVGWTNWAAWDQFKMEFDQELAAAQMARLFGFPDATTLTIPRGYQNTWSTGVGLEYAFTNRFRLRGGAEYRKSSIPPDKIDTIAPLSDDILWGLGAGITIDKYTEIDLALSMLHTKFTAPANTSCNLNCTDLFNMVYNPYAGLDVTAGLKIDYAAISIRKKF